MISYLKINGNLLQLAATVSGNFMSIQVCKLSKPATIQTDTELMSIMHASFVFNP